jgi:hypothetical protein
MKSIYTAPSVEAAEIALKDLDAEWGRQYPGVIDCGAAPGPSSSRSCLSAVSSRGWGNAKQCLECSVAGPMDPWEESAGRSERSAERASCTTHRTVHEALLQVAPHPS